MNHNAGVSGQVCAETVKELQELGNCLESLTLWESGRLIPYNSGPLSIALHGAQASLARAR